MGIADMRFWAVNVPVINNYARNIQGGSPRNVSEDLLPQLGLFDIHAANLLGSEKMRDLFPLNEWSVPVSWIGWGLFFILLLFWIIKDGTAVPALTASVGLLLTLLIASPIWYWPRYGAALQFLVPFYIAVVCLGGKKKGNGAGR